jgi:hypothetical protein
LDELNPNVDNVELIKDLKVYDTLEDYFNIPTVEEIVKLESYTLDEMDEMNKVFNGLNIDTSKAIDKTVDDVRSGDNQLNSTDSRQGIRSYRPTELEDSIKEAIREFREREIKYGDYGDEDMLPDSDINIYRMCTHNQFDYCYEYDTFLFKLL